MAREAMKNRLLPFLFALVAAAVILKSASFVEESQTTGATVARHRDAVVQLGAMRARLENALNARLYVAHALAAYVATNPELDQTTFVPFAQALIARQPGIRSVALIRGTTITHMYPNGVDWLMPGDDTTRLPEEQAALGRAIALRQFRLSSPFETPGGRGLAATLPVFANSPSSNDADVFWGMARVVIDLDGLVADAGMAAPMPGFRWALRGADGPDTPGAVFLGDPTVLRAAPEALEVWLPSGSWQLAGAPADGWDVPPPIVWWVRAGGFLTAALAAVLVYLLARDPARLRQAVDEATRALREREETLEQRVAERTNALATLLQVSRTVASTLEMRVVVGLILEQLTKVVDSTAARVWLVDGDDMVLLAERGPNARAEVGNVRVPMASRPRNHQVYLTAQPVIVEDMLTETAPVAPWQLSNDATVRPTPDMPRSWMGVPLILRDQVIGMISIGHDRVAHFGEQHAQLALAFASQAAVAVENARLFDRSEQRARDLEALYLADQRLYQSLRVQDVLDALVDVAAQVLEADKASVMVWDEPRERLVVGAVRGFNPEVVAQMVHRPGDGITSWVATTGQPVAIEDAANDPRVAHRIVGPEGIRSLVHVPVIVAGEVFGVFGVNFCRPRRFDGQEQRVLTSLAQRAAVAIENAKLYEAAQDRATLEERQRLARELHDAVTQTLFSASLIAEVLPKIWARNPAQGAERLEELRQLTRGALAEMRTLLLELRPAVLTEVPLADLLRQLGEAFTGRWRVPVALRVDGEGTLPPDVQVVFYRIAQESLNNVAKHAGASRVEIELAYGDGEVRLAVCDDGRGFDVGEVPSGHFGVAIMRERAEAVDADVAVESCPGGGTTVRLRWYAREAVAV
jgi:signal transduction histidine kinase